MRETPHRIPLTQSKFALIDPEDFDLIARTRWHAHHERGRWYANAAGGLKMHRVLMSAPIGVEIDHIDGDGLNSRKSNLRLAWHQQNCMNVRKTGVRSHFKGVWPNGSGWCAFIRAGGRRVYLGQFQDEERAARAYDAAASQHHGEFARVNFPDQAHGRVRR